MKRWSGLLLTGMIVGLLMQPAVYAQYGDENEPDTTNTAVKADSAQADSIKADTIKAKTKEAAEGEEGGGEQEGATKPNFAAGNVEKAHEWLRRLLFRGWLNTTQIGAYSQYQLTEWSETTGSVGPVLARIFVVYLGTSSWLGKNAEWLQLVFQSMDEEPVKVEYDILLPPSIRITEVYRVLFRVDGGELKPLVLNLPPDQLDYDRVDVPVSTGEENLELYSGTYKTEKFAGSGTNGSMVTIYKGDLQPLGIVRMGYGNQGLTVMSHGSNPEPRFNVPPPPRVR
jgi:hypothetical protein